MADWRGPCAAAPTHTEIGGERQVCTFDAGLYVNVGAWRIPYSHTGVLNYCRELGVPIEIFINEAENAYFYYEGQDVGPLADTRVRLREVKADMIGYTNELLVKAIDQGQLDLPVTAEDKQRFLSHLVAQGYLDASDRRYKAFASRGPGTPARLRGPAAVRLQPAHAIGAGDERDNGRADVSTGRRNGPVSQGLRARDRRQPHHLQCRRPVSSPVGHWRQGRLRRHEERQKPGSCSADFVVVCMPLSVLSGVDINLSAELMAAVKATTYSNSAKMGLAMKRRFWEEDDQIFGGHLYSNLPLGEFSYPSNDYFSNKGVLLGLYVNGPVGDLLDRSVKERVEHVLTHASKVHPQIRQEFESAYGGVVAQGEVQPRRLCVRSAGGAPRAARQDR